ncbi:unnamed protein product, partial [Durusdinium trenchii]
MCESNTTKQKYLLKAHPSPYLFDNMEDLGSGQAYDVRTQCTVDVPKVDVIQIGYPCKSISSQNSNPASFRDRSSVTGSGYHSLVQYVDYARPSIIVLENVRSLASRRRQFRDECPLDIQNKAMYKDYAPLDIVHKFLCRPLPIDMFLLDPHPPNAACKARGQQKRKQRDESTLKWRDTFKEYAGKLGIADVENNKEKIRRMNLEITERELAILSVAVTEMQRAGWTPFVATFFIQ